MSPRSADAETQQAGEDASSILIRHGIEQAVVSNSRPKSMAGAEALACRRWCAAEVARGAEGGVRVVQAAPRMEIRPSSPPLPHF